MVLFKARLVEMENSLGVVVPKNIAKKAGLVNGPDVTLEVKAENPLKAVFGSLKGWKIDAQKAKDELRKEGSKW